MDYQKRFEEIRDFLKAHTYLHELELLERFEEDLSPKYKKWSDELGSLSINEILSIENNYEFSFIKDSTLRDFIKTAKDLSKIEQKKLDSPSIDDNIKRKMNKKKVHEISKITSLLKDSTHERIIDIGSGAGHLSSALVNEHRNSICIDSNKDFQSMGEEKLKRWSPKTLESIEFINKEIQNDDQLNQYINKDTLFIGLHSCGALSSTLVQLNPDHLLNFGCCYHKLEKEYNLSAASLNSPIWFTNHAKTSAAKGHAYLSEKDFENKFIVKRFRYTLHYFLKDKFQDSFVTLGNAKKHDYLGPFSDYAHSYCKKTLSFTKEELEKYYKENIHFIDSVIKAGTLRSLLGRLIELYIILDRALFLIENGRAANIFEVFERELSPRNIAIYY